MEEFGAQKVPEGDGAARHREPPAGVAVVQVRRPGGRVRGGHAVRAVAMRVAARPAQADGRAHVLEAAGHVHGRPGVGQRVHRPGRSVGRPGLHADGG